MPTSAIQPYPLGMDAAVMMNMSGPDINQQSLQLAFEMARLQIQSGELTGPMASYASNMYSSLTQRFPSQPPSPTSAAAAALAVRRSQNTTECVPVPSSEHVAEIVGKQGCKIKALRSKTATYIKTPVRGEDAVFVITGRREDVEIAKAEILQAAEHFTQIRAQRRLHPPPHIPGQMTIQLPVPLRLVGLIVGPKGQTIKKVQQESLTYIITPGRDKDPVFEITGSLEGVDQARLAIEDHVLARTGSTLEELLAQQNDPTRQRSSSLDNGFGGMDIWRDNERYFGGSPDNLSGSSGGKNDSNFAIGCWNVERESPTPENNNHQQQHPGNGGGSQFFSPPNKQQRSFSIANPGGQDYYSDYGHGLNGHGNHSHNNNSDQHHGGGHRRVNRLHSDPMPSSFGGGHNSNGASGASIWNDIPDSSGSIFQAGGGVGVVHGGMGGFLGTDYGAFGMFTNKSSLTSTGTGDSQCSSSPAESITSQKTQKLCYLCQDHEATAAMVPCGHNLFCLACARSHQRCPICHAAVEQVIRIQGDL